jgi:serine/threonine protein kinase
MFICPECGEAARAPGLCVRDRTPLVDGGSDPLLGQSVGPYRVACSIGAGGMGQVYKGVHPTIGSRVAIKVLLGDFSRQQSLVERFFAEARSVNVIRHESIVNVLDLAWLPDGRPYIVMEFLDGQPLSAVIRQRGALPLGALLGLVREVLDALAAAHAQGIVHRDLKPDNIFVTPAGRAKVLDFGIAKLRPDLGSGNDATATGSILGTPQYMSPEQALGRSVDARADLYSLGVILFQGATGRLPFQGASLYETLRQHIEASPPSPRALRPELPESLEQTILRSLEKEPARRFGSAAELSVALEQAAQWLPRDSFVSLGARAAPSMAGSSSHAGVGTYGSSASFVTGTGASYALGTDSAAVSGTGISYAGMTETGVSPARGPGRRWLWLALPVAALLVLGGVGLAVLAVGAVGAQLLVSSSPAATQEPTARSGGGRPRVAEDDPLADPLGRPGPIEWIWQKPKDFDPGRLDVDARLGQAEAFAKRFAPDVEVLEITVQGVKRDGSLDLALSSNATGAITGRWRSPQRSARPADLPIGARLKAKCLYIYIAGENGIYAMPQESSDCSEVTTARPTCTVKQILAKAETVGAPRSEYVADLTYRRFADDRPRWKVKIGDFEKTLDDSCP